MADSPDTQPAQDPAVEARGLTKIFKDFWGRPKAKAVNGIDFVVESGTVFGLLGPNGSGKSTTVKLLLGLLYPTRGQLTVLGESPERVETKRRIGYLPEESYLYPYLTAAESLDFFGSLFGLAAPERKKRCEQLLQMVGLTSARNRPVGEFSKGMARRIGLAQALVNDPELVILDEPTSGLDPIGCREVKDVIRLLAERGKTVILCSHLLSDVEDVCDQLIVLYGGKICAEGGLKDLLKIEESTRILTPRLDKEQLDKVLSILRDMVGEEAIDVDLPSMNLEQLFLDVVQKARASSQETAGAESGGEIAAYLKEGVVEEDESARHRRQLLTALAEGKADSGSPTKEQGASSPTKPAQLASEMKTGQTLTALSKEPSEQVTEEKEDKGTHPPRQNAEETSKEATERLKQLLQEEEHKGFKDDKKNSH